MKKRRLLWIAALLAASFFLALIPGAESGTDLNFGNGSAQDEVLTASELFDLLRAESEATLTNAERGYLDAAYGVVFTYNPSIPDSLIATEYDGDLGILTVRVSPRSFTAQNGTSVTWVPTELCMDGGEPVTLAADGNGVYTAVFTDLWYSGNFRLDVFYRWQAEIPAALADTLRVSAGAEAARAHTLLEEYESANAAYTANVTAYQNYLAAKANYEASVAAYARYTAAMEVYAPKKAAYDVYLTEKAAYDAKVKAYAEYREKLDAFEKAEAAYYAYEAFRQENVALYDRYERYRNELEKVTSRVGILESMFVSDSHGWQFYSGLTGGTVDSVISQRSKLVEVGVSGSLVDAAKQATGELRSLLGGYAALRRGKYASELERWRVLFGYYETNYEAITRNMKKLLDSISAIYGYGIVRTTMDTNPQTKEKVPHFRQFLAQMYVLSTALDDAQTFSAEWKVADTLSVTELVEEPLLLNDTNRASPVGVTVPEEEVVLSDGEETLPEPVPKPVRDFAEAEDPALHGAPEVVPDPGAAPAAVPAPGSAPKEVAAPGEAPTAPTLSAASRALAAEWKDGTLPAREAIGASQTLTFWKTVTCERSISNRKTVRFYDAEDHLLLSEEVEYGAEIAPLAPPAPPEDPRYRYRFLGWGERGGDGTQVDLGFVSTDLSLAPLYERIENVYEIVWVIGNVRSVDYVPYGQMPECTRPLTLPATDREIYSFAGWDHAIEPAAKDATYTALFSAEQRVYEILWKIGDRTVTHTVGYGEIPTEPTDTERTPDAYLYTFRGWDRAISPVTGNATYTAEYNRTPLVAASNGSAFQILYEETNVTVLATEERIDLKTALTAFRESKKTLSVRWGDVTLSFPPADRDLLAGAGIVSVGLVSSAGENAGAVEWTVRCYDGIRREVAFSAPIRVTVFEQPREGLFPAAYLVAENGTLKEIALTRYAGGNNTLTCHSGETILFRPEYSLAYTEATENCNLTALPARMPVGATVRLIANCTYGYEISAATVTRADGTAVKVTDLCFAMPEGPVTVTLTVSQMVYHVTFVADGQTVSRQELLFGESVTIPPDPIKESDGTYLYTFTGWAPYVTRATGEDRNPVYTAAFSRTLIAGGEPTVPEDGGFLRSRLFRLAVIAFAAVVLAVLFFAFRKKIIPFVAGIFRRKPESAAEIKEKTDEPENPDDSQGSFGS